MALSRVVSDVEKYRALEITGSAVALPVISRAKCKVQSAKSMGKGKL